jgi:hypothetical protein
VILNLQTSVIQKSAPHTHAHTYKEPSISSGTGAAIWSKTNFGPTGHHYPQSSPLLCICEILKFFLIHPGSHILWGCSEPPVIMSRSPQLCQNGGLSVLASIGGNRKVGWLGENSHVFWWKIKWETVCYHDATARSFVAKVRGKVIFTHLMQSL